jgi:hypothetical protein
MSTFHGHETRARHWGRGRWIATGTILIAIVAVIVFLVLYTGGGGSGGPGGGY